MKAGSVSESLKKSLLVIVVSAITLLLIMPLQAALEDPTRPPTIMSTVSVSPEKTRRPRWVLTSTLVSVQRRTAVINDTVVSRGDRINGARVMSILPSMVRLRAGGRDITLMMLKKNIKSLSQVTSSRQGK